MKWSIPEKVIARGRQYLQEGRVLSVVPDQEENVWHAEVLGSELYMVDLDGTAKEIDYCQCPIGRNINIVSIQLLWNFIYGRKIYLVS